MVFRPYVRNGKPVEWSGIMLGMDHRAATRGRCGERMNEATSPCAAEDWSAQFSRSRRCLYAFQLHDAANDITGSVSNEAMASFRLAIR